NQPGKEQTSKCCQEKQARHLQQVLTLFDVTPSEKHHGRPNNSPERPARPTLQLADAEAPGLEFLDERRKYGEVEDWKEFQCGFRLRVRAKPMSMGRETPTPNANAGRIGAERPSSRMTPRKPARRRSATQTSGRTDWPRTLTLALRATLDQASKLP